MLAPWMMTLYSLTNKDKTFSWLYIDVCVCTPWSWKVLDHWLAGPDDKHAGWGWRCYHCETTNMQRHARPLGSWISVFDYHTYPRRLSAVVHWITWSPQQNFFFQLIFFLPPAYIIVLHQHWYACATHVPSMWPNQKPTKEGTWANNKMCPRSHVGCEGSTRFMAKKTITKKQKTNRYTQELAS